MSGISSTKDFAGLKLAPDLDLPSRISGPTIYFESVTFDPSGSLTEALGLTGKHAVFGLSLTGLPTAELVTVKMTVDSDTIWNEVDFTPASAVINLYGSISASVPAIFAPFIVDGSLSLEVETAADSTVTLNYIAVPIL